MKDGFLEPHDPGAFDDIPVMPRPDAQHYDFIFCPVCKGHGKHNLRLNAYLHFQPPHFQQMCGQCWGWGWVEKGSRDETCIHDFIEQPLGMCRHKLTCVKGCGKSFEVDSSG